MSHERLIILDIGGYFAKSQAVLAEHFGARFIGVVEMTENGHQRYEQESLAAPSSRWPAAPQAGGRYPDRPERGLLRGVPRAYPEAYLHVSARPPCSAMAGGAQHRPGTALSQPASGAGGDGCPAPGGGALPRLQAGEQGRGPGPRRAGDLLHRQRLLDITDLQALRPGAMLASVTSADDEFAFSLAQLPWPSEEVCPHVLALTRPDGSTIFLLNRGRRSTSSTAPSSANMSTWCWRRSSKGCTNWPIRHPPRAFTNCPRPPCSASLATG